ncbi:MAG: hypothetical protein C5B53_11520 [Candidatus Melainabacteria bacterium]|nr:MAG: hypothetical protein C5B53_11520 [Candidatus Melainabacteria bacterium]
MSKPDISDRSTKQPNPTAFELPKNVVEESLGGKPPTSFRNPDYGSFGIPSNQELLAQLGKPTGKEEKQDSKPDSKEKKDSPQEIWDKLNDRKKVAMMDTKELAGYLASTMGDTNFHVLERAMNKAGRNEKLSDEENRQLKLSETADKLMDIAFMRDGKSGLNNLAAELNKNQDRFKLEETDLHPNLKDKKGKPKLGATSLKVSDNGEEVGKYHYNFDYTADDPEARDVKEKADKLQDYVKKGRFTNKQQAANIIQEIGNDRIGAVFATANYLAGVPDEQGIRPDNSVKPRSRSSVYYAVGDGNGDDKHLRFHWLSGAVEPNGK